MKIMVMQVDTSSFDEEEKLLGWFTDELNLVVQAGGSVISVTKDEIRIKRAFVLAPASFLDEDCYFQSN